MASPQPAGTLKRPPIVQTPSSSSSLSGMEQPVPSFQSFVKRTPPPETQKPLPPVPLRPRRPSSFDSSSSRPTSRLTRRSSSVYSRGTSIWDLEPDVPAVPSWQTADFADQNMILRPIAYSASTSQLVGKPDPHSSEQRTYSPLINTPSPVVSPSTTPSPPPQPRPTILLPPPARLAQVPKKHLRMVSLEKAKEILQAPGAVHLLPEEMRAQASGRSRSQQPLRIASMDLTSGRMTPPELPEAPTLVDHQGRERVLSSLRLTLSPESLFTPITALADGISGSFPVGNGPSRTMAPVATQTRKASRTKAAQARGLDSADEQRGRARERGPRNISYEHYMPNRSRKQDRSQSPDDFETDAQVLARDYHDLLAEQYRQPSMSPASLSTRSDAGVAEHMKMVPHPLFHNKPAARPSVARSNVASVSPFSGRADSSSAFTERRRSSGFRGFFPIRLSISSMGSRKRRSTSGSIPISPPTADMSRPIVHAPSPAVSHPRQGSGASSAPRRSSEDNRVSAFYPHIMPRKKKGKGKKDESNSQVPAMPMLAADIIAARLKTPDVTPNGSLVVSSPPFSDIDTASINSEKSARRLPRRIFKSATNKLTRSSESPARRDRDDESPMGRIASPDSPHLLPSPSSAKQPPAIHLGWSDNAKSAFDQARSSITPTKRQPEPLITHVQTPARTLDESKDGLAEPESPRSRKGSIFGGLMDGWRENKAEKRRQELKKMITHATPEIQPQAVESPASERPGLISRRFSAYNWM